MIRHSVLAEAEAGTLEVLLGTHGQLTRDEVAWAWLDADVVVLAPVAQATATAEPASVAAAVSPLAGLAQAVALAGAASALAEALTLAGLAQATATALAATLVIVNGGGRVEVFTRADMISTAAQRGGASLSAAGDRVGGQALRDHAEVRSESSRVSVWEE